MRFLTLTLALLALVVATPARAGEVLPAAKPEEVGLSPGKLGEIVPAVEKLVAGGFIPGAVTVVARDGKVVHFEATGLMDIAGERPMKKDTIFRIYSMSKPVTVAAALILLDEGKLELEAPVSRYLPEFKDQVVLVGEERVPAKREMTVLDLMRHTSGLTYGVFGSTPVDQMYSDAGILDMNGTLEEKVKLLAKIPLLYHPGGRWHYSVSIDVLGRVVEVVGGKPFDVFLKTRIFDPLGMVDTGFSVPEDKLDRFAVNYGPGPRGLQVVDAPAESPFAKPATFLSGGGGLVSTATDYLRFAQMLSNGGILGETRILKPETVANMTRNHLDEKLIPIRMSGMPMQGTGFGLGVSVRVARSFFPPSDAIGEYGWAGIASTFFWVVPDKQVIGIVMTQHIPFAFGTLLAVKPLVDQAAVEEESRAEDREPAGVGR